MAQLRGLTGSQAESIILMTQKLDDLKYELEEANKTVSESIETVRKIQHQCKQYVCKYPVFETNYMYDILIIFAPYREISDKNRQMIHRIDEARGEVAVMWEDRLM